MEQEVRQILLQTVAPVLAEQRSFAERINSHFVGLEAEDLKIFKRKGARTHRISAIYERGVFAGHQCAVRAHA